jgi:4-hydroxythreonine-4-phosphate dehydrogenase
MPTKPLLLTMGDACGIGPEIIVKAFLRGAAAGCVVVGDVQVLRRAAALGTPVPPLALLESPGEAAELPDGCLGVLQPPDLPEGLAALPWGQVNRDRGRAAARCID